MTFIFHPLPFCAADGVRQAASHSAFVQVELCVIRAFHAEIDEWDDFAVATAWSNYSRDIYGVSWVGSDWLNERDNGFLAYIYIRVKNPEFVFPDTILLDQQVWDLGDKKPWTTNEPLPAWASKRLTATPSVTLAEVV